ncbi:hypothetical protein N0V88_003049 [Collariella sp. IMI 366227]|nr:hypothetical protein N0V88_003049 [Collariella sp. IMI 366227]
MKLLTLLVSSLATLAIAAPASDNKRAVSFDPATFNNLKSFQQFQALFQRQQAFDVDALLQLQALQTFCRFISWGYSGTKGQVKIVADEVFIDND